MEQGLDKNVSGTTHNNTNLLKPLQDILTWGQRTRGILTENQFHFLSYFFAACGLLIALGGIFTNVINIKTFLAMGVKDGVTTIFLFMSCSDLMFAILTSIRNIFILLIFSETRTGEWLVPINPAILIFFCDNSAFIMYTITVLTSGFLAVVRCMCVARPLQFKNTFTRSLVLKIFVLLYLFPICCQTAVFAQMGIRNVHDPVKNASRLNTWFSKDREQIKDIVRLMLSSILPLVIEVIVVICIAIMVGKLRQSVRFRNDVWTSPIDHNIRPENGGGSNKLTAKERQVLKQVILILTIFVVLNVHGIINSFLTTIDGRFDYFKAYGRFFSLMHDIKTVFQALNATVNIFVYYFYNPKYRALCFVWRNKKRSMSASTVDSRG